MVITEQVRKQANAELEELMDWEQKETDKVFRKMKDEGIPIPFFGDLDELKSIREERNRKLYALRKKYGLE